MEACLQDVLQQIGVRPVVAEEMPVCPTRTDCDKTLPNGGQWLAPIWSAIMEMLPL